MTIINYKPSENVTDKINGEEIDWKSGDIVLISSGTASGKSYFVRNQLEELADKENVNILLLVNRAKLYKQNKLITDNSFFSRIKVELYQNIERELNDGKIYDFSTYKYIVCDESHYFTSDSGFNDNSDDSLNAILGLTSQIKIFMSATGSVLFSYIKDELRRKLKKAGNKIWSYSIPKKYNNIASLSFYKDFYSIEKLIYQEFNLDDDKIVYFAKSVKEAHELHLKYENSMFVCSMSEKNKKYHKFIDDEKVESMVRQNKFDCKYLFTTTVLDNGFDLKDENIKLIICDIFDMDTMLQCIGRKRFKNDTDKVHVVLLNHTNRDVYNYQLSVNKKVDEAEIFIKGGVDAWRKHVGKFSRKSSYMIKDNVSKDGKYKSDKTLSRVKYLQVMASKNRIKEMLDDNRETNMYRKIEGAKKESDAYMMYVAILLKKNRITLLEKMHDHEELCMYLNSMIGKRIFKDGQDSVIEKFDIKDYRCRIQKGINQLQAYLQSNKLKYAIAGFEDRRRKLEDGTDNPNRDKSYWMISKF